MFLDSSAMQSSAHCSFHHFLEPVDFSKSSFGTLSPSFVDTWLTHRVKPEPQSVPNDETHTATREGGTGLRIGNDGEPSQPGTNEIHAICQTLMGQATYIRAGAHKRMVPIEALYKLETLHFNLTNSSPHPLH